MNKDIFLKVLKNPLLSRYIKNHINHIHIYIIKAKTPKKWDKLLKSPSLLIDYNYINIFKHHYNKRVLLYSSNKELSSIIDSIMFNNRLDVLMYLVNERPGLLEMKFTKGYHGGDLLFHATKYGRWEIIRYLESLANDEYQGIKWCANSFQLQFDYLNAMYIAPLSKDLKLLKYITAKVIDFKDNQMIKPQELSIKQRTTILKAARVGRSDMIDWFTEYWGLPLKVILEEQICDIIANAIYGGGHLEFIKYYYSTGTFPSDNYLLFIAAECSKVEIYQFLLDRRIGMVTYFVLEGAAANNHAEVLQWLVENRNEVCNQSILDLIQDLDLAKFVFHNYAKCNFSAIAMYKAAYNNNFEMVKWLHSIGAPCKFTAMDSAAYSGNLEMVKWFHENRTEGCSKEAMAHGVKAGNFQLLNWLHENRTERCDFLTFLDSGSLEMLKWYHEKYPDEKHFIHNLDRVATKPNALELILWLQEFHHIVSFGDDIVEIAAGANQIELIKWLRSNFCIIGNVNEATVKAAKNNHFETVRWLLENSKIHDDYWEFALHSTSSISIIQLLLDYNPNLCDNQTLSKVIEIAQSKHTHHVAQYLTFKLKKIN